MASVNGTVEDLNSLRDSEAHPDVEFHVEFAGSGETRIYRTLREAAGAAVFIALSGKRIKIDCVCWSREGAKHLGGEMVERYDEDPEASVLARIVIRAEDIGRIL